MNTENRAGNRGFAEVALLLYIIGALVLFFVPNPVSSSLGVGIRPNKVVEKVELIKDAQGNPIAYKTTNSDIQQHVGFFEWLRSLPVMVLLLMGLGVIFPPVALFLHRARQAVLTDTKKIVLGLEKAFTALPEKLPEGTPSTAIIEKMKAELSKTYNDSTKDLVAKVKRI